FGEKLFQLRHDLNFSQYDVSQLAMVSIQTIRRIESGKVIPKQETLDYLSTIYKMDLNKLLLEFRINDYDRFFNLKNKIESKLDCGDYEGINIELLNLKNLGDTTSNTYYANLIKQFILLIESIVISKCED